MTNTFFNSFFNVLISIIATFSQIFHLGYPVHYGDIIKFSLDGKLISKADLLKDHIVK